MTIHVALPSGEKNQYEEHQLRALWNEGKITSGAVYWKEGMEEWKPLEEYMSPYATPAFGNPPPALPGDSASAFPYTVDPRRLTRVLIVMLWINLVLDGVSIASDLGQLALLGGSYSVGAGEANDLRQGIIGIFMMLSFLVTGITFLKWIRRANINCAGFSKRGMEFTPGWSIGWYFIPIASIFKPYQAMREIWQVSHDPRNPHIVESGPLLKSWWGLWLFSGVVGQISFRMSSGSDNLDDLKAATVAAIVSSLFGIFLTFAAISLVKRIAAKQEELVNGSAGTGSPG